MNVQRPNRDEYKRIVNVVKTVLGVKYHTRSLGSIEECEDALIEIVTKGCETGTPLNYYKKKCESYENKIKAKGEVITELINKNFELIHKLNRKKWWQEWKNK